MPSPYRVNGGTSVAPPPRIMNPPPSSRRRTTSVAPVACSIAPVAGSSGDAEDAGVLRGPGGRPDRRARTRLRCTPRGARPGRPEAGHATISTWSPQRPKWPVGSLRYRVVADRESERPFRYEFHPLLTLDGTRIFSAMSPGDPVSRASDTSAHSSTARPPVAPAKPDRYLTVTSDRARRIKIGCMRIEH